ncbi:MAG: pseudaminic acid cytidylyltransferase [Lachnospiraceae bacterium]|nr:pseudaminic acid cytidylyltransferase [Lachnospiraceae bacterium]
MKKIAIITARGGSKRIPHKNMLPFLGKPIIAYSIEAALSSGEFDEVMVSTDDENIAKIAKEYGASVPFMRSERTANDFASTADVLFEVLDEYEKRGEHFDVLCCIYPTAVFITDKKIKEAMGKLVNSDFDTLLPVVKFSYPVQRSLVKNGEGLEFKYPEYIDARSQDLEPHFHDAGQFYIMKTEDFKRNKEIMKGKIMPYELPEMEVQDIDTMSDWHIAEIKFQAMKGEN